MPPEDDEIEREGDVGRLLGLRRPQVTGQAAEHQQGRAHDGCYQLRHVDLLCDRSHFQYVRVIFRDGSPTGEILCSITAPVRFAEASEIR